MKVDLALLGCPIFAYLGAVWSGSILLTQTCLSENLVSLQLYLLY